MGNLFSDRLTRPRSLRAALLGAAAVAAVGGLTIEALPLSTYPAFAGATVAIRRSRLLRRRGRSRQRRGRFGQGQDRRNRTSPSTATRRADAELPQGRPAREVLPPVRRAAASAIGDGGQDREQPHMGMAQGSGFFISSDGYIVTNNHVVEHAKDVTITTADGKTVPAQRHRHRSEDRPRAPQGQGRLGLSLRLASRRRRRASATG